MYSSKTLAFSEEANKSPEAVGPLNSITESAVGSPSYKYAFRPFATGAAVANGINSDANSASHNSNAVEFFKATFMIAGKGSFTKLEIIG